MGILRSTSFIVFFTYDCYIKVVIHLFLFYFNEVKQLAATGSI